MRIGIRIIFGGMLTIMSSCAPSAQVSAQGVPLAAQHSGDGSFSILVPRGWNLSQIPGADFSVIVAPPGPDGTGMYMLAMRISDQRYTVAINGCSQQYARSPLFAPSLQQCLIPAVQAQLQDSSHAWSAGDSLRNTLQFLSGGGARFQITKATNVSDRELQYTLNANVNGRAMVHWGELVMFYVPNQLLGNPGITSVALIKGCHAPPERVAQFRSTCAAVITSFAPAPDWEARQAARLVDDYNQEAQILIKIATNVLGGMQAAQQRIARWGNSMKEMQMQTYEAYRESNLISGQNGIAALGGYINRRDPNTGGPISFPPDSGPYCIDSAGRYVNGAQATRDCAKELPPYQYP